VSGILQKTVNGLNIEWPCEKESLGSVHVLGGQPLTLTVVLDSLGDGFETERFTQLHHGVDQSYRLGRLGNP
jgi:hypothetical protein